MSETLLLVLCLSGAGLISGLTGFAFALVASGTLLSIRPPVEATALVLVCSILSQSLSILRLRTLPPRATVLAMIGPGLVGAPIGIYLLHDLNPALVKVGIGAFLILYSAVVASLSADFRVRFGSPWSDAAIGFVGGVLGGIAGLSGALPTAWSLVRGWDPRTQRAVYQTFTLVLQVWALVILALFDPLPAALLQDLAVALPIVLVSVLAGLSLFARIDQARFRTIVLALLAIIGLTTAGLALPSLLP
ncbi:sulfite exporter TauE/SafE family protein [Methylobacterium nigriterrae]|uniref:sulfite exporter TauE/SafE family protein n=1 Tax=Methylobacterium nigriterrae TaxID=3127512 RepID=UPI0030132115